MALHVSLRYPVSLGGCVALSSWIPLRNDYPATFSDAQKSIPIIQVHGNAGATPLSLLMLILSVLIPVCCVVVHPLNRSSRSVSMGRVVKLFS